MVSKSSGSRQTYQMADSSSSANSFQIPNISPLISIKLDGTNYLQWTSQFLPTLHSYDFLSIVDGSEACQAHHCCWERNCQSSLCALEQKGPTCFELAHCHSHLRCSFLYVWIEHISPSLEFFGDQICVLIQILDHSLETSTANITTRISIMFRISSTSKVLDWPTCCCGQTSWWGWFDFIYNQWLKSIIQYVLLSQHSILSHEKLHYHTMTLRLSCWIMRLSLPTKWLPLAQTQPPLPYTPIGHLTTEIADQDSMATETQWSQWSRAKGLSSSSFQHQRPLSSNTKYKSAAPSLVPFNSTRPPCQICGKPNHQALNCYHRMDYSYQGRHLPSQLAAMVAHTNS